MIRFLPLIVVAALVSVALAAKQGDPAAAGATGPHRYIVVLKDGKEPATVTKRHGFRPRVTYKRALNGFAGEISDAIRKKLEADADVAYIEEDKPVYACSQTVPTGIVRIGTPSNPIANIGAHQNVNVGIAIMDTGIAVSHPDLNVVGGWNFITNTSSYNDNNGHGTHCAGIAAAIDNATGVVGVAPGARLWGLKVLSASGSGNFSDVITALDWVTTTGSDIGVINMSFGGTGPLQSLQAAIRNTVAAGVVCVAAAGNDAEDVYGPDGIYGTADDSLPAAYPEVCCVAALADSDGQLGGAGPQTDAGPDDTLADFSNYSLSVTPSKAALGVVSPGGAIDLAAPGIGILSTYLSGSYAVLDGTSMAAPHVTGAVALYIAANGRAHNAAGVAAIRQVLINQAQPQSQWGPVNVYNPGLPMGTLKIGAVLGTAPVTPTLLGSFSGNNPASPYGSLMLNGATLYGMTHGLVNTQGKGVIFSVPTSGGTPKILFTFDSTHGANPYGSLLLSGTTLYGMTSAGGTYNNGTVFSIPIGGSTPTVMASFNYTSGAIPWGDLALGGSTLYGMASTGGIGYGTIFSIPTGGGAVTTLFTFDGTTHGAKPYGGLTLNGSTLYGMTYAGGAHSSGTIFSVPTSGGTPTVLYSFENTHGANPYGNLLLSGSTLYGMTSAGGANGYGVIFSIPTSGGTPTILYSFANGEYPQGSLTLNNSILYGMTQGGGANGDGEVFSIPISGGTPAVLAAFDGTHGAVPYGSLLLSGTTLYGMTNQGGSAGNGAVFSVPLPASASGYTLMALTPLDGTLTVTPSQASYTASSVVTISQTTNSGYAFTHWAAMGGTLANANLSATSLTITGNCVLAAVYVPSYSSTLRPVTGGTISLTSSAPYILNQVVGLTASANPGWQFTSWSATGASLSNSTTPTASLTVLGNFTLAAVFTQIPYTVTVAAPTGGVLSVSPSQQTYTYSTTATITATASLGYAFSNWVVTGSGPVTSNTSSQTTLTVGGNLTLSAVFTQLSYTGTKTDVGGSITLSSTGPYYYGTQLTATAAANPGFMFTGWTYSGCSLSSSTALSTTLTVLNDFTLTANFIAATLTVSATLDNSWVYQNTTVTTSYRQCRTMTITVPQDTWPDQSFTVAISQSGLGVVIPSLTFVNSGGNGAVTPTSSFVFTGSSAVLYLVGGPRQADGVTGAGPCAVTLQVTGNISAGPNATTVSVLLTVRPLGDITGDGAVTTADRVQLRKWFNLLPTPNQMAADFDLDGDGAVTANDLTILNTILNNLSVP